MSPLHSPQLHPLSWQSWQSTTAASMNWYLDSICFFFSMVGSRQFIVRATTCYYMLLHATTWYYVVLHGTTWYYILLHTTTYYYMLHTTTCDYMLHTTCHYMPLHATTCNTQQSTRTRQGRDCCSMGLRKDKLTVILRCIILTELHHEDHAGQCLIGLRCNNTIFGLSLL
jgi:hypothetical protein